MKCRIHLFTLLLLFYFSPVHSFCQWSIDSKINYFYKDVLNEYVLQTNIGGRIIINTNNGEIVLKGNKKYIKPSKLGEIIITIEEITNDSKLRKVQYFKCIPLPDPFLYYSTTNKDTLPLSDTISKAHFRNLNSFIPKIKDENILAKCTLVSYEIEIIGKKWGSVNQTVNKIKITNLPEVNVGDKVLLTNILVNIEGAEENRRLSNRLIEITE